MTEEQRGTVIEALTVILTDEEGELFGLEVRPHRDGDYVQGPEIIPAGSWRVECGVHYHDDDTDRTYVSIIDRDGALPAHFEVQ